MSISLANHSKPLFLAIVGILAVLAALAGSPTPASAAAGGIGLDNQKSEPRGKPGKARLRPNGKAVPPRTPRIVWSA